MRRCSRRRPTARGSCGWARGSPAVPPVFSARVSGTFVAEETGAWRFSLVSAGRSRLLVDGTVVVDNWEPTPGGSDSFFGLGSTEVKADVWFDAGSEHAIVVEYANDRLPSLGGLAIGCEPPRPDDLFERAVALAARPTPWWSSSARRPSGRARVAIASAWSCPAARTS